MAILLSWVCSGDWHQSLSTSLPFRLQPGFERLAQTVSLLSSSTLDAASRSFLAVENSSTSSSIPTQHKIAVVPSHVASVRAVPAALSATITWKWQSTATTPSPYCEPAVEVIKAAGIWSKSWGKTVLTLLTWIWFAQSDRGWQLLAIVSSRGHQTGFMLPAARYGDQKVWFRYHYYFPSNFNSSKPE